MRQPSHLQESVFPKPECHLDIGFVSSLQLAQLTFKRLADGLATTLEKKSVTFVSESTTGLTPQSPQVGTINRTHCLEAFLVIRGVWDLNGHNCYKSEGTHFPALRLGPALQAYKIFFSNFGNVTTDGIPETLSRNTQQLQNFAKKYLSMRNFNTKSERH